MKAGDNPATKMLYLSEEQVITMLHGEKIKGRKEVAEWLLLHRTESRREFVCFTIDRENWQAKLKEWRIE